jgi:hypothetical protein
MSESLTYYSENPAESQKVQLVGTFSLEGSKIESHVRIGLVMGRDPLANYRTINFCFCIYDDFGNSCILFYDKIYTILSDLQVV